MQRPVYDTPEPLRTALAGVFTTRAVGRARAIKLRELEARVDTGKWSGRQIRAAIAELIEIDGLPIAGLSSGGYFMVSTWAERSWAINELVKRIRAMARRVRVLATRSVPTSGQIELDYTSTPEEIAQAETLADRLEAVCGQ